MNTIRLLMFGCFVIVATTTTAQKIIFNFFDSTNKNYELMQTSLDGKQQQNISNHHATDWTYYTYGNQLFFISDRDTCNRCFFLYKSNGDGSNLQKVSNLMLEDSWMSSRNNGQEMLVSGREGNIRNQLFIINLQTGGYQQLTNDTAAYHNDPVFVNDGAQIAFRYKAEKRNRNMKTEIWLMNSNGSGLRQLTHYPAADTTAPWYAYHAGQPKWNAKGGFISYQSMQQGKYQLYAITPDGKKQWQLTNLPANIGWHDWSTDGNWLVADYFNDEQSAFDIIMLNPFTKELHWITKGGWRLEYAPVFIQD